MRKDQQRALWAYKQAAAAEEGDVLDEYRIAVQAFAATLHRNGLAVAASMLERNQKNKGYKQLLNDIARQVPVFGERHDAWPAHIRDIEDVSLYMLKTREILACITWLRRACSAIGGDGGEEGRDDDAQLPAQGRG